MFSKEEFDRIHNDTVRELSTLSDEVVTEILPEIRTWVSEQLTLLAKLDISKHNMADQLELNDLSVQLSDVIRYVPDRVFKLRTFPYVLQRIVSSTCSCLCDELQSLGYQISLNAESPKSHYYKLHYQGYDPILFRVLLKEI